MVAFRQHTVRDLLIFVLRNRRNTGAFRDWSIIRIIDCLKTATAEDRLRFCVDSARLKIEGLCIYKANPFARELFIEQIICKNKISLVTLLQEFKSGPYKDFTLSGHRDNHRTVYNRTDKLVKLLATV